MPSPLKHGNHKSALDHCVFVTKSVQELIKNRCVMEAKEKYAVVANREDKLRLVLNLRHLNQINHFKYEDLSIAMLMLEKQDYLIKFDLKLGYHHLDIFKEH